MGKDIVQLEGEFAEEEARGWESKIFREVCEKGRKKAAAYMERLDEALYKKRPTGWQVIGYRERKVVTRFGEVGMRRRLYRDAAGAYHLPLDEYIGIRTHQAATAERQEICVRLGKSQSFREAAKTLEV